MDDWYTFLKIIIISCAILALQIFLYNKIGQDVPTDNLPTDEISKEPPYTEEQWRHIEEQWKKISEERWGSNNKDEKKK